jgi:hypothetical protein
VASRLIPQERQESDEESQADEQWDRLGADRGQVKLPVDGAVVVVVMRRGGVGFPIRRSGCGGYRILTGVIEIMKKLRQSRPQAEEGRKQEDARQAAQAPSLWVPPGDKSRSRVLDVRWGIRLSPGRNGFTAGRARR